MSVKKMTKLTGSTPFSRTAPSIIKSCVSDEIDGCEISKDKIHTHDCGNVRVPQFRYNPHLFNELLFQFGQTFLFRGTFPRRVWLDETIFVEVNNPAVGGCVQIEHSVIDDGVMKARAAETVVIHVTDAGI